MMQLQPRLSSQNMRYTRPSRIRERLKAVATSTPSSRRYPRAKPTNIPLGLMPHPLIPPESAPQSKPNPILPPPQTNNIYSHSNSHDMSSDSDDNAGFEMKDGKNIDIEIIFPRCADYVACCMYSVVLYLM